MSALCSLSASEYPQTAYAWRDLLFQNHILPDEVSNTVIIYGLHLRTDDASHPAFEGFCEMREPGVLTAFHLKRVLSVYGETDRVYVVENEMMFSCMIENLRETPMTLLCTSGQPRTVALKVLELLAQEHIPVFYSGDIDPEGIRIADRIWQKFPDNVHIWRMGICDYEKAVSEETVNERRLAMLEHVVCPELKEISGYIREKKKAAYQERLLGDLMEDIRESGL